VEFEAVIGLEVHAQLSTESKIFCACRAGKAERPNANACPVCSGHPGTLPVLNRKVVEYAIRAGLATGCRINPRSRFARKNYFYPDLPKGYQISQYELPICEGGRLRVGEKWVGIQRIHMEEDAGKNVHHGEFSLVDLNRAGVPLIEIVSRPELSTPEEAGAYLRAIHGVVTYLGICDGNMQEGNFRCDANVSVMPKGSATYGTRVEIKNVNSFRFVEKAIEYEIARQIQVVRSGGEVVQETRTYDSDRNATYAMRSKEEAHDYRYFPDPDLIELRIDEAWIEEIRAALPELPEQKRARYVRELGLSDYDAGVLTASQALARFFDRAVELGAEAKAAANLVTGEISRLLNESGLEIPQTRLRPEHVADLVTLVKAGAVSSTGAKKALGFAWGGGGEMKEIVAREGLAQVSDTSSIEPVVDEVLKANPAQVAELKGGKDKVMGFLVGQIMKKTGGKANPTLVQELIRKKL
jgi:aspartyl-tRNA(Asn)/glutamyl-tRNA(Gln) amidotransferase subunit B